ncbi:hypothetical protein M7I_6369 [Glarea lozoyensis 74030]|uniref:Uncharacterized protein n=1 Tax=Glarea lozoyensis (strain ATCC 74030 / MF5533) TaxID=1104152 RepID=H0EUD5_GLAL7|nr:hypothetical protein M7I_6369 [Glarea lozoyensis 74030]
MSCKLNRTENVRFQKAVGVQEEVDEADDESESDRSEGDIDNLLHLETFIKTSASLIFLKTALELYVHNVISNGISNKATTGLECPAASQAGMNKVGDKLSLMVSKLPNIQHYRTLLGIESQLDPEKKQAIILDAQKQLRSYFNLDHRSDDRDDPTLSWLEGVTRNSIVAMPTQQHFAGTELSKRVLASEGWRKCTLLLEQLEIIRPELQFGKTRIEWKCKCGHTIYDDFTELKPGAAERYRNMLDSSKIATNGEKSHSTATTRNSMSGFIQAIPNPHPPTIPNHSTSSSATPKAAMQPASSN